MVTRLSLVVLLLASWGWGQTQTCWLFNATGDCMAWQPEFVPEVYELPIVTRHPKLPLPEPNLLTFCVEPCCTQTCVFAPSSPPEPMVVPAIRETDTKLSCHDVCNEISHVCWDGLCEYETHWKCKDASRALLVSEDGKQAWCVKF